MLILFVTRVWAADGEVLLAAERALAGRADPPAALAAAGSIPPGSPDWALAQLVAVEANRRMERDRDAVFAASALLGAQQFTGRALMAVAQSATTTSCPPWSTPTRSRSATRGSRLRWR